MLKNTPISMSRRETKYSGRFTQKLEISEENADFFSFYNVSFKSRMYLKLINQSNSK